MIIYRVDITKPAEDDLRQIVNYISIDLREPTAAQHVIRKIATAIFELEKMPFRYSLVADEGLAHRGIRKMIVGNYIVFYAVSERQQIVTVIRILYGKRNWNHLL